MSEFQHRLQTVLIAGTCDYVDARRGHADPSGAPAAALAPTSSSLDL